MWSVDLFVPTTQETVFELRHACIAAFGIKNIHRDNDFNYAEKIYSVALTNGYRVDIFYDNKNNSGAKQSRKQRTIQVWGAEIAKNFISIRTKNYTTLSAIFILQSCVAISKNKIRI